jgi:hypothetical protein
MGDVFEGVRKLILAGLLGTVLSWLCLVALLVVTITSPANQVARYVLLGCFTPRHDANAQVKRQAFSLQRFPGKNELFPMWITGKHSDKDPKPQSNP